MAQTDQLFGTDRQVATNSLAFTTAGLQLGARTAYSYLTDPKHLLFNLSRYKFVAKMLAGCDTVLEVGCGDGFGSAIVAQSVGKLTALDLDHRFIEEIKVSHPHAASIDFMAHDMLAGPMPGPMTPERLFDAAFSLDVLEHIDSATETLFMQNIVSSLNDDAVCVIGMPSLESQRFASEISKQGHVNCKTAQELHALMTRFFRRVFIFSMNDEVVHTGFHPMAHYLLALCVCPRGQCIPEAVATSPAGKGNEKARLSED